MKLWLKRLLYAFVALCGLLLVGDLGYSLRTHSRQQAWESTVSRNEDGIRVGCEEFQTGSGPDAIVLVHGINDSPRVYQGMAELLAAQGYACYAIRLPGFAIPVDAAETVTREDWKKRVRDELQAVRAEHKRVYVVAHSLGGAITISVLQQDPGLADGVALLAPAVDVSSRRSPILKPHTWHKITDRLLVFTHTVESPYGNDAKDPDQQAYPWRTPFTKRSTISETFRLIEENKAQTAEFRTPLLMVVSGDDQVIDPQAAEQFYDRAASQPKQIVHQDQAAHALPIDYGWLKLTGEIGEFFRRLKPAMMNDSTSGG